MDIQKLIEPNKTKLVLLVLDGLGGAPFKDGKTELEAAATPNMDALAKKSELGFHYPVDIGITPGSGPAHLGLFGYDPVKNNVGRGILDGLGAGMPIKKGDIVARINFCSVDEKGILTDRRAGRIATEICEGLIEKLKEIKVDGAELIWQAVKEYRAGVIIRGEGLGGYLIDTDPQKTGVATLEPDVREDDEASGRTVKIVKDILKQARAILKDESPANMIMLRGFDKFDGLPSIEEKYKLKCAAIAVYPMYKGVSGLVGMDVLKTGETIEDEFKTLKEKFNDYDYFFIHIKKTDSYGEDGNFEGKVKVIEEVDKHLPEVLKLNPDALFITGDHSTPSLMKSHSFHPVPVLISSPYARFVDVNGFNEKECAKGSLGNIKAKYLMRLMLAHSGRLIKFGA